MSLPQKAKYSGVSQNISQQSRGPLTIQQHRGQHQLQVSVWHSSLGSEEYRSLQTFPIQPQRSLGTPVSTHDMSKSASLPSQPASIAGLYPTSQPPPSALGGPPPGQAGVASSQTQVVHQSQGHNINSLASMSYYPQTAATRTQQTRPVSVNRPMVGLPSTNTPLGTQYANVINYQTPIHFQHNPAQPMIISPMIQVLPNSQNCMRFSQEYSDLSTEYQPHQRQAYGTSHPSPHPYVIQMPYAGANSQQGIYFPHMMQVGNTGLRQPVPNPPQHVPSSSYVKREKKLIDIVDPKTGRNLTQDFINSQQEKENNSPTPPVSGASSIRGTSPAELPANDVASEFAAKVAAVATPVKEVPQAQPELPLTEEEPPVIATHQSPPTAVASPPRQRSPSPPPPVVLPPTTSLSTVPEMPVQLSSGPLAESSKEVEEPTVLVVAEEESPEEITKPAEASIIDDESNMPEPEAATVPEVSTVESEPASLSESYVPEEEETVLDVEKSATESEVQDRTPSSDSAIPESETDIVVQQNGEVEASAVMVPAEPKEPESKERKTKTKKRMKELNKKGESKEGGDMDAFVDKEELALLTPASVSPSQSPVPSPVDPVLVDGEAEPTEEERRKVAEKNEENTRVSLEMQDADESRIIDSNSTPAQTLKYNYKEDQWSPLNPMGRKQYDRSFLLRLQSEPMSLQKPDGLPNLDVIKDTAIQHKLPDINRPVGSVLQTRNHPDPFMPNFARNGVSRPPPSGIGRRQSQPGRDKPKKVITLTSSLNQDVKLHSAENAWKPTHKGAGETPHEDEATADLYRKVRGILNKLTPQKFQSLVEQVKHLNIDSEDKLKGVIDLVFEKALDEPNFSVPYANMCKHLALFQVPTSNGQENQVVNFRKLLLLKCQREFEKDTNDEIRKAERLKDMEKATTDEERKLMQDDLDDDERKAKRRSLGNIRFIGELYNLNMLTAPIMYDCLRRLLSTGDEDSLECLCRLLATIGKELDSGPSKGSQPKGQPRSPQLDEYFKTMEQTVKKRNTSARVRFMLQDVIELRQRKWVPRRDENNPKTIDQIHQEAQREQDQEKLMIRDMPPKRSDDRDRKKGGRGNAPYSDDGWSTVHGKNKQPHVLDMNKIRSLSKQNEVDTTRIQLHPGGPQMSSWAKGSSGGNKSISQQEPETKSSGAANRFSALAEQSTYDSRRSAQRSTASSRESSKSRTGQLPPPLVRKTPSQTSSRERQDVIDAVKTIAGTGAQESKPEPTKEEAEKKSEPELTLKGTIVNEEELQSRTESLFSEFICNVDFQDAIQNVAELASPETIPFVISSAISHMLDRSSETRDLVGQLLKDLVKRKVVPVNLYLKGLKSILEIADDMALDIPKIWEYMAELMAPAFVDGTLSLKCLVEAAEPCKEIGKAGVLAACVLKQMAKKTNPGKVAELWKASDVTWNDFLQPSEDIQKFVKEQDVAFTISGGAPAEQGQSLVLSFNEIKSQLDFFLNRQKSTKEEIIDWIEATLNEAHKKDPKFIRALVTSVVEHAIKPKVSTVELDENVVKEFLPLLQRYLDHKEDGELQALYALQLLMNRLQHPKGILVRIFDLLYDSELISEDAFNQWEKSTDPAEQEGKGVALKSVTSFFTWLRETEADSNDDN